MATRREMSARYVVNKHDRERDASENNGYIRALVSPLEHGNYSSYLNWLGLKRLKLSSSQIGVFAASVVMVTAVIVYVIDIPWLLQRLLGVLIPCFSILCAFYWLALFLRKSWSSSSVYLLFLSCHIGEIFAQLFFGGDIFRPLQVTTVLVVVSICSIFSSLQTTHSTLVIIFISLIRFISGSTLIDIPVILRPFLGYFCGILGCILAKSVESSFRSSFSNQFGNDGKIPVIRRRRTSSSAGTTSHSHKTRRTSLPALIQKQPVNSVDVAAMQEAHGMITDMLVDQNLPPNIVSGLKAISNLISPPTNYSSFQRPKISPLIALSECSYGSDVEDSPFIGERPSALPKRLRRSLPPNLLRRMSSTWTTTTSATGMPTLEPEPVRTRSSSFRHSRDSTPNASPSNSRSVSPTPTNGQFTGSRSFTVGPSSGLHPRSRSRGTLMQTESLDRSDSLGARPKKSTTPLSNDSEFDNFSEDKQNDETENQTENTDCTQDITLDVPNTLPNDNKDFENLETTSPRDLRKLSDTSQSSGEEKIPTPVKEIEGSFSKGVLRKSGSGSKSIEDVTEENSPNKEEITNEEIREEASSITKKEVQFDPVIMESNELLNRLDNWDFPIFDLALKAGPRILSQIAYRIFTDAGIFETFRIPTKEFMNYFQRLEDGYRNKPYHNRIHAGDVLHAVYYLSTQPIPGFRQQNPEDVDNPSAKSGSSSDTDSDSGVTPSHTPTVTPRASFATDDKSYGVLAGNLPALELMALYVAAAMHDYDHPGRTNAFLVATRAPQAILYNDRAVLENHHAAAAWSLLLSNPDYNFLSQLDEAEFKRFRFLVIEFILATDLKRHFDFLVEFNAKVNDPDASGIDWTAEPDRLLVSQMCIKLADISGPTKYKDLHISWTTRIAEEFYEQGDEEAGRGLPISPYMDRRNAQLAKLQETFINHLVAPLCNAYGQAGLLPGHWAEEESDTEGADHKIDADISGNDDSNTEGATVDDDEDSSEGAKLPLKSRKSKTKKIVSILTKHIKENHEMWIKVLEKDAKEKAEKEKQEQEEKAKGEETDNMETIQEESKEQIEKVEKTNNTETKQKQKKKVRLGPVSTMVESDQSDDCIPKDGHDDA
ncbi:cGMP-inhibited 3',5'-cyclic phosphodiesterase 3A-like [Ptychodera flava]|uniref:cGMP-inhibited 3',5'-cyclic phosphodiesterase 3A-like n=1 Tax=Ptychodera flava TaxID=63121 RepID=UPI00396A9EB1